MLRTQTSKDQAAHPRMSCRYDPRPRRTPHRQERPMMVHWPPDLSSTFLVARYTFAGAGAAGTPMLLTKPSLLFGRCGEARCGAQMARTAPNPERARSLRRCSANGDTDDPSPAVAGSRVDDVAERVYYTLPTDKIFLVAATRSKSHFHCTAAAATTATPFADDPWPRAAASPLRNRP